MDKRCPFCERIASGDVDSENQSAVAFPDAFPLSPGHTLITPKRHERDFFLLGQDEQRDIWELTAEMQRQLVQQHRPDGFNIGVNVGEAAGQTVAHAHLHLVPRYGGDVGDPRGGVRWIIPAKAPYWDS